MATLKDPVSTVRYWMFAVMVTFIAVFASARDALSQGEIWCWGYNEGGLCEVPTPNEWYVDIAGGFTCAAGLRIDGSIVVWGENANELASVPQPNTGFMDISVGSYHMLGLKRDGSIVAWGRNNYGQCNIPAPNSGFVAIAAGGDFSLGLRENGAIVIWGYVVDGLNDIPTPNADFSKIAAGYRYALGLKNDGSIVAWGNNGAGQCDVPTPNTDFIGMAGAEGHSLGLKLDGSIVAWGANNQGQCNVPEPNADFVSIAAGDSHSLGLKSDGSVVAWGWNFYGQCDVPTIVHGVTAIASGVGFSMALDAAVMNIGIEDIPGDQGGFLSVSWDRHWCDFVSSILPITTYNLERYSSAWELITSTDAIGADSYAVQVATPDIYIVGQPEYSSLYRLVARTADPAVYFESEVDSGYSIDNLAPPPPDVQMMEYGETVILVWQTPDIPDFQEACVFSGTTPAFVPDEPIGCSATPGFVDHPRVVTYYAVQFSDIHGNLSEFSEVVHTTATAAGDQVPSTLALLPPYPNPFNPRTTLSFTLPAAGHAILAIFDARGQEVARLVDEALAAGEHSVDWTGVDAAGRALPSGTYFCRLSTPWGVETRKLQLVR